MASILGFFSVSPAYAGMIRLLGGEALPPDVSPAYAGMIPRKRVEASRRRSEPRIRGDDPDGAAAYRDGTS